MRCPFISRNEEWLLNKFGAREDHKLTGRRSLCVFVPCLSEKVATIKVELKALKAQLTETQFVKASLGEANAQLREQVEEAKNNGGTLSPQWSAAQAGDAASSNDEVSLRGAYVQSASQSHHVHTTNRMPA